MKNIKLRHILRFLFFTTLLVIFYYKRAGVNGVIRGFLIGFIAFLISLVIKKFIRYEDDK